MTAERFGPYRLVALLGRGGMGEVWRAVDTVKDRTVALKLIGRWLGDDADFVRRFEREAASAARLNAPNIVPIHGYGEIDGRLYIDMALIHGTDLGAILAADGPLPTERVAGVITQVGRALTATHRAGLLHRDVKPSNILVVDVEGDDHVYLIDFGIVRAVDGTKVSVTGTAVGTPAYMAPERFAGEGDIRSDVYAVGCVLHEALTGRPPFTATNPLALMNAHQNTSPPRTSTLREDLPAGIDDIVARAMAKDPEARYASAAELTAAVRTVLLPPTPEVVAATSPSTVAVQPSGAATALTSASRAPSTPARPTVSPPPGATPARRRVPRRSALIGLLGLVATGGVTAAVNLLPNGRSGAAVDEPIAAPLTGQEPAAPEPPVADHRFAAGMSYVFGMAVTRIDGRVVVVSGTDESVQVNDLRTGELVVAPSVPHNGWVYAVALAELTGRPVVVSASTDGAIRIMDLASGALVRPPLTGHVDRVEDLVTAEVDGRPVVVSGGFDQTVRVWDLATGTQIGQPLTGHTSSVSAVVVAELAGRQVVVSGSGDFTVRIWDLATRTAVGEPLTGLSHLVEAVAVTRLDGREVVVGGSIAGRVVVWDPATGETVGDRIASPDYVTSLSITQLGGRAVVVIAGQSTTRVWDLATRAEVGTAIGGPDYLTAMIVADVDQRPVVLTGTQGGAIRVVDLATAIGV